MFDHDLASAARARDFAATLLAHAPQDRAGLLHAAIVANGGALLTPTDTRRVGTHLVEISLHGIRGAGSDLDAALSDWIDAARQCTPRRADPTTTAGRQSPAGTVMRDMT